MPKVKFTALVSDMKGKANGSVFASNAGGTYFRTNKTGGGRKSQDWAKNKNKFADISSMWKSLTEQQKQAWKDARNLYPTTNAFGEVRYPTSFELYMRLNGALNASNLPILEVPYTPRTMPQATDVSLIIPNGQVFTPERVAKIQTPSKQYANLYMPGTDNPISLETLTSFCARFLYGDVQLSQLAPYTIVSLLTFKSDEPAAGTVFFQINTDNTATFYLSSPFLRFNQNIATYIKTYTVPLADISEQLHIIATVSSAEPQQNILYINGCKYDNPDKGYVESNSASPASIISYIPDLISGSPAPDVLPSNYYEVFLGAPIDTYYFPWKISDYRLYQNNDLVSTCTSGSDCSGDYECINNMCQARNIRPVSAFSSTPCDPITGCTGDNVCVDGYCVAPSALQHLYSPYKVLQVFYGYLLNTELQIVSFQKTTTGYFPDEASSETTARFYLTTNGFEPDCTGCTGNDFECVAGRCVYVGDRNKVTDKNKLTYGPMATFPNIPIQGDGFCLQVYFSKSISAGRSIEQVPYVLVGTFPISEYGINISQKLLALQGNFANDATMAFKCKILDSITGLIYNTDIPMAKPAGNIKRFKAGKDLMGKVG